MKNNAPVITAVFVIIVIIIIYTGTNLILENKDIVVSNPEWECEYDKSKWSCRVIFNVTNNTSSDIYRKISVRGLAMKKSDRRSDEVLGEARILNYKLSDYQSKIFTTTITSKRKPTRVNLTIIDAKINM